MRFVVTGVLKRDVGKGNERAATEPVRRQRRSMMAMSFIHVLIILII
jgi:hypothetical protein